MIFVYFDFIDFTVDYTPFHMVFIILGIFLAVTISKTLRETNLFLSVDNSVLANRIITFENRWVVYRLSVNYPKNLFIKIFKSLVHCIGNTLVLLNILKLSNICVENDATRPIGRPSSDRLRVIEKRLPWPTG